MADDYAEETDDANIDETAEEKLRRAEKNLERISGQLQQEKLKNRILEREKDQYEKPQTNGHHPND